MRFYLRVALILFVAGFVIGAVFANSLQATLGPMMTAIKTLAVGMKHDSIPAMAGTLFVHNLTTSLIMIAGGIVFGIVPVLFVLLNGALIGFVIAVTYHATHVSPFLLIIAGILPHGIFEIPAYLLASGIGIRIGVMLTQTIAGRNKQDSWKMLGKDTALSVVIVAGLLLIAAGIEAGVTPLLLKMVM